MVFSELVITIIVVPSTFNTPGYAAGWSNNLQRSLYEKEVFGGMRKTTTRVDLIRRCDKIYYINTIGWGYDRKLHTRRIDCRNPPL